MKITMVEGNNRVYMMDISNKLNENIINFGHIIDEEMKGLTDKLDIINFKSDIMIVKENYIQSLEESTLMKIEQKLIQK
jgi:hypothetical protein